MTADEVDMSELLKKFRKFEKASHDYFNDFRKKIKSDREFLSGEHYGEDENKIFGKKRYKSSLDVTSNVIRSTVNQYSTNPYSWLTPDNNYNLLGKKFLDESTTKTEVIKSLRNSVSFGLGFLNNTTVVDSTGLIIPEIYSINDPLKVWWDPDSIKADGSDATQCIIVDIKSKDYIERMYGEDFLMNLDRNGKPTFDISEEYDADSIPILTYYVRDRMGVTVYKIINDRLLENPITMNINRLPIVPVYGEEIWDDDKVSHRGIVSQTRPIQLLVDFAYSQLCERLAKAPKNAWVGTKEAIEGNEEYFKNFDKSINPLLLWNKYDGKKNLNEAPVRIDMSAQFGDLTDIITSALGLIQNTTGVSSIGIPDERGEITATEALLNAKSFATNIRNYFDNLKDSFRACGSLFFQLIGKPISVKVIDGPEDEMSRECARTQLTQLLPTASNESEKKAITIGLLGTYNNTNEYISMVQQQIQAGPQIPPEIQQQLQQQQQQLQMAEENAKAVLEENNKLQAELLALQNSNAASVQMKAMEIESKERIAMAELQLKYNQMNAEATVKLEQESLKQEASTEREIIKADTKASEQIVDIMTRG